MSFGIRDIQRYVNDPERVKNVLLVYGGMVFVGWYIGLWWLEEGIVFVAMAVACFLGYRHVSTSKLHPMFLRGNPGIGLIRVAIWASILWCVFTLEYFGSERIVGIWYAYYLVIAAGAIMSFGLLGARSFGLRLRVDVYERKNFAAAIFIAAFVVATGMIIGGSMWGESEPEALEYGWVFEFLPSYEEAGWIIWLFFLMGWGILFATMKLWFYREKDISGERIRRGRSVEDARAAALYCLGCAIPITDAVSGDYHGLGDSLLGFSLIALPVLAHEVLRPSSQQNDREAVEPWTYVAAGLAAVAVAPFLSEFLGFR